MQEKRNKRRFILLVLLTLTTLIVLWWIQPENRLDIDADRFRVDDLAAISRVELTSEQDTVVLAFEGGSWRVNDRYNADAGMIKVLFATLQQAQPKRAVVDAQRDSVFRKLEHTGVKVSLFDGGELRKEFLAGGNSAKTQALFGDTDTGEVYFVTIPGYRVYVAGILELDANGWRDKFVFGFNWRNFKSMEAKFPKTPGENFTVSRLDDHFGIPGIRTDTAKLNTFLDDVSLLTVEEYVSEPKLRDSLRDTPPGMELRVTDIGNRTYSLAVYLSEDSRDGLGLIQNADIGVFSRKKIQSLLKPKSFFREK